MISIPSPRSNLINPRAGLSTPTYNIQQQKHQSMTKKNRITTRPSYPNTRNYNYNSVPNHDQVKHCPRYTKQFKAISDNSMVLVTENYTPMLAPKSTQSQIITPSITYQPANTVIVKPIDNSITARQPIQHVSPRPRIIPTSTSSASQPKPCIIPTSPNGQTPAIQSQLQ